MPKLSQEGMPSLYQDIIHKTRYARWDETTQTRETWAATVSRYFDFMTKHLAEKRNYLLTPELRALLEKQVRDLGVMPSMRTLMTAGPALEKVQMANYNCTALGISSLRSFSELMYILMTGSGVGFSVERAFTDNLPHVRGSWDETLAHVVVEDSREGWCEALAVVLDCAFNGTRVTWDLSEIRPAGSRLKTFGGYASGGEVLGKLFEHILKITDAAVGRKLTPYEVFSIATYIAQVVVVGGVRRSATICLFDKDDDAMLRAKADAVMFTQDADGKWIDGPDAHFCMANISAVYETKPSRAEFDGMWKILKESRAGEPGIFNRDAFRANAKKWGRSNVDKEGKPVVWLANPCCEIQLRPNQACNLSAIAVRADDTLETLRDKAYVAAVLGTFQASITDFDYVSSDWKNTIEEDALLGVCLSGIMDSHVLSQVSAESAGWLNALREVVRVTNIEYAALFGIRPAASYTSVKPAGNSGELYDTASGIHPRHAPYYVRRIRQSGSEPMTAFLETLGFPCEVSAQNGSDRVFSFPVKAPANARIAADLSALAQLEHWLHIKRHWATHTVSCTITVRDDEWAIVGDWVYENFDEVTGLSFFPLFDQVYPQMPYEEITEDAYVSLMEQMPSFASVDWELLKHFEKSDTTKASQEMTCIGGACAL